MALITCPECGGKVSDKAASCPHCGYPMDQVKTSSVVRSDVFKYDDTTIIGMESYPNVMVPEGVESVSKSALNFVEVKCIELPVSLKSFYASGGYEKTYDIYYDGTIDQWTNIRFDWIDFLAKIDHLYIQDPKGNVTYNNKKYALMEEYKVKDGCQDLSLNMITYVPNIRSLCLPKSIKSIYIPSYKYNEKLEEIYYEGSSIDFINNVKIEMWNNKATLYVLSKNGTISRFKNKYQPAKDEFNKTLFISMDDNRLSTYRSIFGDEHVKALEIYHREQRNINLAKLPSNEQFDKLINELIDIRKRIEEINKKSAHPAYNDILRVMNDYINHYQEDYKKAVAVKNDRRVVVVINDLKEKVFTYEKYIYRVEKPFFIE